MSKRDSLRSAAFQGTPAKRIPLQYNGCDFELLAPTVKLRKLIMGKAKRESSPSILDMHEWVAIYCTVEPGTDTRIFDETDFETFENMQMGAFLDIVGEHTPALLNVVESPKPVSPELKGTTKEETCTPSPES